MDRIYDDGGHYGWARPDESTGAPADEGEGGIYDDGAQYGPAGSKEV